jgi:hypothetical protein
MIAIDSPVWPVNEIRLVVSCTSGSAGGEVSVTEAISKNILETYLPLFIRREVHGGIGGGGVTRIHAMKGGIGGH